MPSEGGEGERGSSSALDGVRGARRVAASVLPWILLWSAVAILIAARRPEPAPFIPGPNEGVEPVLLDLNRDPWPRLTLIEGIGEALARRIVTARDERGGFETLEEVMALPGIPDGAIERARPWLRLSPRTNVPPPADEAAPR